MNCIELPALIKLKYITQIFEDYKEIVQVYLDKFKEYKFKTEKRMKIIIQSEEIDKKQKDDNYEIKTEQNI